MKGPALFALAKATATPGELGSRNVVMTDLGRKKRVAHFDGEEQEGISGFSRLTIFKN